MKLRPVTLAVPLMLAGLFLGACEEAPSGLASDDPAEAFQAIRAAGRAGDWGTVYDSLDRESRTTIANNAALDRIDSGGTVPPSDSMRGAVIQFLEANSRPEDWSEVEMTNVQVGGGTAVLTTTVADGSTELWRMTRIDGRWRLKHDWEGYYWEDLE